MLHGKHVKEFSTRADPNDPDQLHRLLTAMARRNAGGAVVDLLDYELEVRNRFVFKAGVVELEGCLHEAAHLVRPSECDRK